VQRTKHLFLYNRSLPTGNGNDVVVKDNWGRDGVQKHKS